MKASDLWRERLLSWKLPQEILDQAVESPWIHPPVLFQVPDSIPPSPSHARAIEAIPDQGSVLDIGCGGGIAAFAAVPPASHVIGVDHQLEMLKMFLENAAKRGVTAEIIEGFWPQVEHITPKADVVTSHHVVYNVPEIIPFLVAMNVHARNRVVIEMPTSHPLSNMSSLWKHFWNLDRPQEPTHVDLLNVLDELGIRAQFELWTGEGRAEIDLDQTAHFMRIRLCLPENRESEVRAFLSEHPIQRAQSLAIIWWDKSVAKANSDGFSSLHKN